MDQFGRNVGGRGEPSWSTRGTWSGLCNTNLGRRDTGSRSSVGDLGPSSYYHLNHTYEMREQEVGQWPLLTLGNLIIFYEGKYFTGRKLEVCGDCDNFQDRGFMNRVNSIRVESGAWICFDHPDFRGQQFILERGEYPDFYRWNGHNDHMGSCRPVGMHGEHYRLEIFEGCNFTGGSFMKNQTTGVTCTWWRGAITEASMTGRPTAPMFSPFEKLSTSSRVAQFFCYYLGWMNLQGNTREVSCSSQANTFRRQWGIKANELVGVSECFSLLGNGILL
uniref:Gamma-crystallin N n=1 Tax=Phascolarctos cinereus TaxID=38626 RepID=A0A6P5JJU8_PHACI|nr:gamma-crystallin N isoform X3 [Phascolarctos cinereus]